MKRLEGQTEACETQSSKSQQTDRTSNQRQQPADNQIKSRVSVHRSISRYFLILWPHMHKRAHYKEKNYFT